MKLRYIAIVLGLAAMTLTSCKDFLDKAPDTRVDLVTPADIKGLLLGAYTPYNYAIVGEFSSDNVIDLNAPREGALRFSLSPYEETDREVFNFEDVKTGTGSDSPSEVWEGCFRAIAYCNAALKRVAEIEGGAYQMTDEERVQLSASKGEALVSRAYHYFILAQVFCMPYRGPELSKSLQGLPYVTEPESTVMPQYQREDLATVYAKIEKDLLEGLPLINDATYEAPKYHFNKTAASAFAARFYLFTRDYEKCLKYANDALANGDPVSLMSDIWAQEDFYYISDINRYFVSVERPGNFLLFGTYSQAWRRFLGYRYAPNGDARRATIQGPGPSWNGCRYINNTTQETFAMHPCFYSVCGTAGDQRYGSYFAGTCGEQFEYSDKLAGIGYCHVVRAEFTGEETLLCRAEAKLFLGDIDGAFNDLNVWDQARRNYVAPDDRMTAFTKEALIRFYETSDPGFGIVKPIHIDEVCPSEKYQVTAAILPYLQCVQHFRRISLVHTGMRWFDIKRYGLSITHRIATTSDGQYRDEVLQTLDPRYAIQIPDEVIAAGFEPNDRVAPTVSGSDAVINTSVSAYYK